MQGQGGQDYFTVRHNAAAADSMVRTAWGHRQCLSNLVPGPLPERRTALTIDGVLKPERRRPPRLARREKRCETAKWTETTLSGAPTETP